MNTSKYLNASRNIYREYDDDLGFEFDQPTGRYAAAAASSTLDAKADAPLVDTTSGRSADLFLIDYLNKEFVSLGFESFLSQSFHAYFAGSPSRGESMRLFDVAGSDAVAGLIDSGLVVRNTLTLIERYKRNLKQYEEEKEKCHRLNRENELFHKRQINLKESNEASNKDYILIEEKLKQYEIKFSNLSKANKETSDENRRLNNMLEQRDKQFKHDKKKLETELNRLKDRIKTLTNPKSVIKEFSNMEISDLVRQSGSTRLGSSFSSSSSASSSSRGSWSNNCDALIKKQMEMYSDLIRDYESKTRELIAEQNELKQFVNHFYLNMCVMNRNLAESSSSSFSGNQAGESAGAQSPSSSTSAASSPGSAGGSSEDSCTLSTDLSSAILNQPFENVYFKLNKQFQSQFNLINRLIAKKSN